MIDSAFCLYSIFFVPLYCFSSYNTILNSSKSTINLRYNFTSVCSKYYSKEVLCKKCTKSQNLRKFLPFKYNAINKYHTRITILHFNL